MKVLILTPEKTIYEGETISLQVPFKSGSFQLLENHTSIIVLLKEGNIILQSIGHCFIFCIRNGFLKIKNSIVKILIN